MADLLPEECARWVRAEAIVREVMRRFGFGEIRFPVMEPTELFERGIGATTDIVQKEMYILTDRGDRSVTLRPEGTPSVVRAYLEESLGARRPAWKLFFVGPMFRAERPQPGRLRQFHQFGAELIGPEGPEADVELISLGDAVLRSLGVKEFQLVINSIGSPHTRGDHNAALRWFLASAAVQEAVCPDCRRRAQTNPLRVFDCKVEQCRWIFADAPTVAQFLTAADQRHFNAVRTGLDRLKIAYVTDERLVRGFDYYTRTTFEFQGTDPGAQDSLIGGGRYDALVETLGGPPTPAAGFAGGLERILAASPAAQSPTVEDRLDVFVCALSPAASELAPEILATLRRLGLSADRDFRQRGLEAQMEEADRSGARQVLIIGDEEIARGRLILRATDTSAQTEIDADHRRWTTAQFRGDG